VIICDTHGRTLREGQVNVSIGSSGILPFRDYRGVNDSKGYLLRVKQIAAADEVAGAAELVIGQAQERIPVAVVRGLEVASGDASSSELNMPKEKWFFKPDKAHTIDMESIRR
jgi:coenzyme F420-0:L-glutamate ligase/coenzyme F420-1:gamma-L-glutamate ligase